MKVNEPDDEHTEVWYLEPKPDDYMCPMYLAYQEVLKAIEKLAEK